MDSSAGSLYCDLGATLCWWSSVLLKLCGEMLQVYDMNNGTIMGNRIVHVLLIGFAFADGMPELLMFVVINAINIACIVFWYLIKNTISVSTSIMSHVKAA